METPRAWRRRSYSTDKGTMALGPGGKAHTLGITPRLATGTLYSAFDAIGLGNVRPIFKA